MELAQIQATLAKHTAAALVAEAAIDATLRVSAESWPEVARALRHDPALAFDFLVNLTAVDWAKRDELEIVYHLWSYVHRHALAIKVTLPRQAPQVASVSSVWRAAEWNEREQFDLLGVDFTGHPDLRRILMPEDWPGHPMRKDYVEAASYRGMPTTRPNPLELLAQHDRAHAPPEPASSEPRSVEPKAP